MKIIITSDTHNHHPALEAGDLLLHAGDFTGQGTVIEIARSMQWLREQPQKHKVIIAGNHDWLFERQASLARSMVPENVHYLENSGVEVAGKRIWGTPLTPPFMGWAFNASEEKRREAWSKIPQCDILLSHGPPLGVCDLEKAHLGDPELLSVILRVKPKLLICGHIHGGYGHQWMTHDGGNTLVINASHLNEKYQPRKTQLIIDWKDSSITLQEKT